MKSPIVWGEVLERCYDCGMKFDNEDELRSFGVKHLCIRCISVRSAWAVNGGIRSKNKEFLEWRRMMGGGE